MSVLVRIQTWVNVLIVTSSVRALPSLHINRIYRIYLDLIFLKTLLIRTETHLQFYILSHCGMFVREAHQRVTASLCVHVLSYFRL